MKVRELQDYLNMFEPDATVYISSDEELNTLYNKFDVAVLDREDQVVIYGLDGFEVDDEELLEKGGE